MNELFTTESKSVFSGNGDLQLYISTKQDEAFDHWHRSLEIIKVLSGTCYVTCNNNSYVLSKDDICFIPYGISHQVKGTLDFQALHLFVNPRLYFDNHYFTFYSNRFYPLKVFYYSEETKIMLDLLNRIHHLMMENYDLDSPRVYKLVSTLLSQSMHYLVFPDMIFPSVRNHSSEYYIQTMYNVCSYIRANCTSPISIRDLSSLTDFSDTYFAQLFKKITSVTWYQFYRTQQLLFSLDLLVTTDLSIDEICSICGFQSLTTFHRLFQSFFHASPVVYRKKYLHF